MEAITAKYFRKKKKNPPKVIVTGKLNCLPSRPGKKRQDIKAKGGKEGTYSGKGVG